MSLVDRSFEEVCAIMDRTGDTVELLVEHAADFRMCDLLDDPAPLNPGAGSGGSNLRKSTEDSSSGLAPGKNLFFFFLIFTTFIQFFIVFFLQKKCNGNCDALIDSIKNKN